MRKTLKHYLIPHEANDHRPHLLREEGVMKLVGIILAVFVVVSAQVAFIQLKVPAAVVSSVLVDLSNTERHSRGISSLSVDPVLVAAAELKAKDMAAKGYFSHVSPEGYGLAHWLAEAGYNFIYAGENLAVHFSESDEVERAWMESSGHRSNILNNKFTHIGIATAHGMYNGRPTVFVVQMFGTRMPQQTVKTSLDTGAVRTATAADSKEGSSTTPVFAPETISVKDMFIEVKAATGTQTTASFDSAGPSASAPSTYSNSLFRIMLEPTKVMAAVYGFIAIVIIAVIGMIAVVETKKHHVRMVLHGATLVVTMAVLLYVFGVFVVANVVII